MNARILVATLAALFLAACSRPLPEEGSPSARLYIARCGTCHAAYQPSTLTPAMWEVMMKRMDPVLARNGLAPLVGAEREDLVAYLRRNAGVQ